MYYYVLSYLLLTEDLITNSCPKSLLGAHSLKYRLCTEAQKYIPWSHFNQEHPGVGDRTVFFT